MDWQLIVWDRDCGGHFSWRAARFQPEQPAVWSSRSLPSWGRRSLVRSAGSCRQGIGWAAGAMTYIVVAELIRTAHENGHGRRAVWSFLVGVSGMLFLDVVLS